MHVATDLPGYEKRMVATIPSNVHEANDVATSASYDPAQTSLLRCQGVGQVGGPGARRSDAALSSGNAEATR